MKQLVKSTLARFARHGLSGLGAVLVAKGVTDEAGAASLANLADFFAGAGMFTIALGWSWLSDKVLSRGKR
jgi:NAD(P)H-hydrate repair Nnr-like enzyme with NAD(P)H-hydrate dehydratase domain